MKSLTLRSGVLALLVCAATSVRAAEALPPDLDLVPRDALGFFHIRTAELWKADAIADVRHLLKHAGEDDLATFVKQCPVAPDSIDRVTFFMLSPGEPFPTVDPEAVSALVAVHTTKPYSRTAIQRALGYREKIYRRHLYYFHEDLWTGLYLVDDQTLLIGSEEALIQYFDRVRDGDRDGPLAPALATAAGARHLVLGINPAPAAKEVPGIPGNMQPLVQARCATLSADLDKETRLELRFDFKTEEQAKAGDKALRTGLTMLRGLLTFPISELQAKLAKDPKAKPNVGDLPEAFTMLIGIGFMRELDAMMKDAAIEQKGTVVRLPTKLSRLYSTNSMMVVWLGAASFGRYAMSTFSEVGQRLGGKDPHEEHMRKLYDAMERYRQEKKSYPPAAIYDHDGRPLLSWRVALLPYLGEEALYREFRLDEPWDSLHNKKLIKRLPQCLKTHQNWRSPRGKTSDLVVTGPNTVFEGTQGTRREDADDKTILVIQTGSNQAVYWTKPADLALQPGQALPDLFEKYGGEVRVILVNSTYRTFQKGTADKEIQELIPRKKGVKPSPVVAAKKEPATLTAEAIPAIWARLAAHDDDGCLQALVDRERLNSAPQLIVPFLRERLKAAAILDRATVARHIADLDSNDFATRNAATKALETFGARALPLLEKKLEDKEISLEMQNRLKQLIAMGHNAEGRGLSADELRVVRGIGVLQDLGTPEAKSLLASLAKGDESAAVTVAAQEALRVIGRRSK